MDLIGSLASALGVDPRMAEAVAGSVLGATQAQAPDEETAKLDEAVPEIAQWKATAEQVLAEEHEDDVAPEGLLATLTQAAGSGLGNQLLGAVAGTQAKESAAAVALLSKLGLQPSHAGLIAPVVLQFLEARIGSEWLGRLLAGAPLLAGLKESGDEGGAAGGLGGLLGGLLGRD